VPAQYVAPTQGRLGRRFRHSLGPTALPVITRCRSSKTPTRNHLRHIDDEESADSEALSAEKDTAIALTAGSDS
jgi:hypothetical protein